jgi:hypothetical protein
MILLPVELVLFPHAVGKQPVWLSSSLELYSELPCLGFHWLGRQRSVQVLLVLHARCLLLFQGKVQLLIPYYPGLLLFDISFI